MVAAGIHQVLEEKCITYPVERINRQILSIELRIEACIAFEACIADQGRNCFHFSFFISNL